MQLIQTLDGSYTLKHDSKGHYHSIAGARQEALLKFVKPALTTELLKKDKLVILDFCFGFGYKTACLLDVLGINEKKLIIYGLEIDKTLLNKIQDLPDQFRHYNLIKKLINQNPLIQDKLKLQLIFGDARKQIKKIQERIDICFYDPFSPSVEPGLWTEKCFRSVYKIMNKGGVLTTYSCARTVQENMQKAGFIVKNGPEIGRRGPSTIGYRSCKNKICNQNRIINCCNYKQTNRPVYGFAKRQECASSS
ncbi:hypothetical protein HYV79_01545 [Candidatus Woesearchaeota archaeon]|nr:hypothetical protein [Candidatus Woesearchaeota archaeon]